MMRQMRENTKWIMLITALAFVALMVFEWGMDATGRSGAQVSGGELGRVDGSPVSFEEYNAVYQNLYNQQRAAGNDAVGAAMNRQIEESAWRQIVVQKLIAKELDRRGIRVTDEEVRAAARDMPPAEFRSNPMFQTNGQFDIAKYREFLASPAVDDQLLSQLEAYYREVIPRSKLYFQVTAGSYLTDAELWRIYRDATETATARFVAFDPNLLVPDAAVTVTEDEIERYYREHEEDLQREAQASVRYVALNRAPTAADTAAARARVDSARARLASGEDFATVVQAFSSDSGSIAAGGQYTIRRGQMVAPFEEAAFSRPLNQIGETVTTQYGYHIMRVEARDTATATVRHVLIPIVRTPASEDALLTLADSLEEMGENNTLEETAQHFGLPIQTGSFGENFPFLAGLGQADDGADWAFNDAPEPGEVSPVLEAPNAFYMLELVALTPAGTIPLEDAREAIQSRLATQKKLERTRQIAREAQERLGSGGSLEQIAAQHESVQVNQQGPFTRVDFVPGLGRLNAAVGAAFGLQPGERSGIVEAEDVLYIVETIARTQADSAAFEAQKETQRAQATQNLAEQRWNEFLTALEENADVIDNRKALERAAQQQRAAGLF